MSAKALAHGPTVEPRGDIGTISILDIAPSVLHAMGEDVPEDFEGTPVPDINISRNEVTTRDSLPDRGDTITADSEEVQERLADLGHLE